MFKKAFFLKLNNCLLEFYILKIQNAWGQKATKSGLTYMHVMCSTFVMIAARMRGIIKSMCKRLQFMLK